MPTNQKKIPNIIKSLQSSSQWRPLAAVWPHPLFLAHLFLLSSHCFAERGVAVAKSARQAAAGALFVRLQLGGSSLMPCPGLCAPAGPSRCHRLVTALPSSVKAMQYWRIVELNAILWGYLLHSDTLTTHTQTSSHAVHCHAHPVCSPLH